MRRHIAIQLLINTMKLCTWIAAALLVVAPGTTPHARAANVSATDANAPAVQQSMWVVGGKVESTVMSGNTIYLGGSFRYVGPATGGFGIVDQSTGQQSAPTPNVDGTVYTMAADGMGGWYIGGTFTRVGGLERNNLAHILANGTTDPVWNPNATTSSTNSIFHRVVWALAASNGVVYAGGEFTSINGQTCKYLAALDAVTGAILPQNIQTDNMVWAMSTLDQLFTLAACSRR